MGFRRKSRGNRGSEGRVEATASGVVQTIMLSLNRLDISPEKATVVIQGFGNAGSYIAKFLHEKGLNIIGVSDSRGGVYNPPVVLIR